MRKDLLLGVLALVAVLIGAAVILQPAYIQSAKKDRTEEALRRVELIHKALADWHERPELAKGKVFTDVNHVGSDGRTFREHFPREARWILDGDKHYKYAFLYTRRADGKVVPRVTATAKNLRSVDAELIITDPDGKAGIMKAFP